MKNKEFIVKLIQQDLKHHQLVIGLDNLGLNAIDKHLSEIFDLVYDLMEVPELAEDEWGKVYTNYMNIALKHEINSTSESLNPLAEKCFTHLQAIVDLENEKQVKS